MKRSSTSRILTAAFFGGLMLLAERAVAATYSVTTTIDHPVSGGVNPANGVITGGSGNGSVTLRSAIIASNANAGADVINLLSGIYTLSIANTGGLNEDGALEGDLDVVDDLAINGAGSGTTIIQAGTNTSNGIDKVFAINPVCDHAVTVSISDLTIRHGRNTQVNGALDFSFTGGGIDFCGNGASSFTISNSLVTLNTNTDGYGGGINIDEVAPATSVVSIVNTQVTLNTSKFWGGGMNTFGDNAQVTITNSNFDQNTTLGTGGAGAQGGGLNIRITNQNDGDSAPVPFTTLGGANVRDNVGVGFGGGIDVAGSGDQTVTISNTVITGNVANVVALGVTNTTGGGLDHSNNPARTSTLTRVLIANNQSNGGVVGTPSNGGGIAHGSGNLIVRNSTISGNSAKNDGGGVYVTSGPVLTLTNVTAANNRANSDDNSGGAGGGLRNLGVAGAAILENTISDGNLGTGASVNEINGPVTANFSLIGNTAGATVSGASNQINLSARLGVLAANGVAAFPTHALLAGSAAHDNGSNALASAASLTTDQRGAGFARVLDAADVDTSDEVDIGAYEAHPAVLDVLDTAINEDGSFITTVHYGDVDLTFDTVTASSGNTTLVPNAGANISLAGPGSSRTLTINPVANFFGLTTITLTVTDTVSGTPQSMTDTFVLTVSPVADPPNATGATTNEDTQTASGLVLSRNAVDGAEVTHFQITGLTNGALFLNNGVTPVANNSFVTFAQGNAGLRFTPAANLFSPGSSFGFNVSAATSGAGAGISPATSVSITVNPVADAPTATQAVTAMDTQSTTGLVIARNAVDSTEVTHFRIGTITSGTLYKNDGTTQLNNGDFITFAEGNAGLKFTPTTGFTGIATFLVAASLDGAGAGLSTPTTADIVVASAIAPGDLVIREFRLRGPASPNDEYVVIHNKTGNTLTLGALDGSAGYSVGDSANALVFTIPNGTILKPSGYFLAANTSGFTLGVVPDAAWTTDVADGRGLAIFNTANATNYAPIVPPTAVIDAVGTAGGAAPYIEGAGLPSLAAVGGEYAWVRRANLGAVQDTDGNAADFIFVATNGGIYNGVQSILGAPAPTKKNLRDVYNGLTVLMAEPLVGPNLNPNRIRTGVANSGTLEFRRRITNNTGASISALRLRVNDLSTLNSPGYLTPSQADLRPGTGPDVAITATSIGVSALEGLTLLTPPVQAIGGGVNSILLLPSAPIANGASIDINIRLNISRVGSYRFFMTVEAQ